jgi:DNA-binding response OmpR family regulator
VPSPHQSSTAAKAQHSVLLLEDYDALAAAIASALKKFAPGRSIGVAQTLAEAEKLAGKNPIELLIIDFDPSYPGLTAFLQKMRKSRPEARALVLAGGIPNEIVSKRRSLAALQFIEKPYEIADFGAAVQALLGPWNANEAARSRGTLGSLGLADIVALQCAGGRSVVIDVKGTAGDAGVVHVLKGQIVHAETDEQSGPEALAEMFDWASPRIRETEKRVPGTRTIQGPWADVFLQACHQVQSAETAPEEPARPKTGKKIVVVDDTEMLLIFVEDALTTANPELQITTALNGMNGVSEVGRVLPDLVLLDYSLPDINGDEVCRRLSEDEKTAQIPILMMSGHVAQMKSTAAHYKNIVATIEKPFLSEALVDLVQRTLTGPRPALPAPRPAPAPAPLPVASPPVVAPKATPPPPPKQLPKEPAHIDIESDSAKPKIVISEPPPPEILRPTRGLPKTQPTSVPVPSVEKNEVMLGLFLEVISMQLTPQLRMGAIRARPASSTVSLHFYRPLLRVQCPAKLDSNLARRN